MDKRDFDSLIGRAGASPITNKGRSTARVGTAPGGSLQKNQKRRHNYSSVLYTRWRSNTDLVTIGDKKTWGRHCVSRKRFGQLEATTQMCCGIAIFESQVGKLSIEGHFYDMLWQN